MKMKCKGAYCKLNEGGKVAHTSALIIICLVLIGDLVTKTYHTLDCPEAKKLIEEGNYIKGAEAKGFEQIGYKAHSCINNEEK